MAVLRDEKCIFCTIASGEDLTTTLLIDNETFVAFADIKPISTHHYLVITKSHIRNVKMLTSKDIDLVNTMKELGSQLLASKGVDVTQALFGFHFPPFNTVNHLHLHCISGPTSDFSFFHRMAFKPGTPWFATVEQTIEWLEKQNSS